MKYKNVNDYEVIYMIRENDEDSEKLMYEKYSPYYISMLISIILWLVIELHMKI